MCKKYIVVDDLENGGFHLGDTKTAEGWREWAMGMNDYDEFDDDLRAAIKNRPADEVVWLIAEIWQLDIEEFDENNPSHIEAKNWWENDD